MALLSALWLILGTSARADEGETPEARALRVTAALPAPSEAAAYRFEGKMRRPDGTEVGEFQFRAEPAGDRWKVGTRLRWTQYPAQDAGGTTWKPVDVVNETTEELTQDLSTTSGRQVALSGGVQGTGTWDRTADGYRVRLDLPGTQAGEEHVPAHPPCLGGMASFVLLCRLMPRDATDYAFRRLDPSHGVLPVQASVEGVRRWDVPEPPARAWLVQVAWGGGLEVRVGLDPKTREPLGIEAKVGGETVVLRAAGAGGEPAGATPAERGARAAEGFPASTPEGSWSFEGVLLGGWVEIAWLRLSATATPDGGWRLVESGVSSQGPFQEEALADRRLRALRGTLGMTAAKKPVQGTWERSAGGYRVVLASDDAELEGEARAPEGAVPGLVGLIQTCRLLSPARATYQVPAFAPRHFNPRTGAGVEAATITVLGEADLEEGTTVRKAWFARIDWRKVSLLAAFDPASRALLGFRGLGTAGFTSTRPVSPLPSGATTAPAPAAAPAPGPRAEAPAPPATGEEALYMVEYKRKGSGAWYKAWVVQVEGDKYFVHYVGESEYSREWVTADRMRPLGGSPPVAAGAAAAAPVGSPAGSYGLDGYQTNEVLRDPAKLAASADWILLQRLEAELVLRADGTFRSTLTHKWTKESSTATGTWKADGARIELTTTRVDEVDLRVPLLTPATFDGGALEIGIGTGANYPYLFKRR